MNELNESTDPHEGNNGLSEFEDIREIERELRGLEMEIKHQRDQERRRVNSIPFIIGSLIGGKFGDITMPALEGEKKEEYINMLIDIVQRNWSSLTIEEKKNIGYNLGRLDETLRTNFIRRLENYEIQNDLTQYLKILKE